MAWLSKLCEWWCHRGICLEIGGAWEISPPPDIPMFIRRLPRIAPPDAILYLEGSPCRKVRKILGALRCEPRAKVARAMLFPHPECFHVAMTEANLESIAGLFEDYAPRRICYHFQVYADHKMLLEWGDAFHHDPLLVSGDVAEGQVADFCQAIGSKFQRAVESK